MPESAPPTSPVDPPVTAALNEEGEPDRTYLGIDGTMGDAQDVTHPFIASVYGEHCRVCGLARAHRKHNEAGGSRMDDLTSGTYQQMPDGSWQPAQPLGWQEEHGPVARLIFWLRRIEHCNDREGQRRA